MAKEVFLLYRNMQTARRLGEMIDGYGHRPRLFDRLEDAFQAPTNPEGIYLIDTCVKRYDSLVSKLEAEGAQDIFYIRKGPCNEKVVPVYELWDWIEKKLGD